MYRLAAAAIIAAAFQGAGAQEGSPVTFPVGAAPHGMVMEGDTAYVAFAGEDAIGLVDLATHEVTAKWPVGPAPLDLVRFRDGWLVTVFAGEHLVALDAAGRETGRFQVGKGPSLYAERGAIGGRVHVVSELADELAVFNLDTGTVEAVYKTGKRPYLASVTRDGVLAFVPNRDAGTVSVIDLLNREVVAEVPACARPSGGALSVDDVTYLVACRSDDEVAAINTASYEIVGRVTDGIGPGPFSVAVSADGRRAFVNNAGGTDVSVIDLQLMEVTGRIDAGTQPIVLRVFGDRLIVSSEGSNTMTAAPSPVLAPPVKGGAKTQVLVLGMIHGGHRTSERYSTAVLKRLITAYGPDQVLAEIPPNRMAAAMQGFVVTGAVSEERVARFPEYVDVLFPLTREMKFEIVPTAAWTAPMAHFRAATLERFAADAVRRADIAEDDAAQKVYQSALAERGDDPVFVNSDEYDRLTKISVGPYDRNFNDDLGPGGWTNVNRAHYANIAAALDRVAGEGKRILITYGAGHKYWFLEQLRRRGDIEIIDAEAFVARILSPGD